METFFWLTQYETETETESSYHYQYRSLSFHEYFNLLSAYNAAPASSSCTQRTIDGSCCKFPFTHNSQTYNKCIDDNDSYGPWCLIGYGTKGYCRTEEASKYFQVVILYLIPYSHWQAKPALSKRG